MFRNIKGELIEIFMGYFLIRTKSGDIYLYNSKGERCSHGFRNEQQAKNTIIKRTNKNG